MLVNQLTLKPTLKMQAVGYAGGGVMAIVTLLALFGVIVPDDVSQATDSAIKAMFVIISAVQVIITFAAGYFKKSKKV